MSLADYACADEPAHVFAYRADCLTFLRSLPDDWTHAVITDPPYGLAEHRPDTVAAAITAWAAGDRERVPDGRGFMGRSWDAFVPPPAVWDECLRVLKPGGHLAVFAGSRTVDLMGLSIRLAGFEMRDTVAAWLYGSGFPKSHDVGKAIDAKAGATREVVGPGRYATRGRRTDNAVYGTGTTSAGEVETAPVTDAAREWQGWGTALKPSHEPILLARKPCGGTVAATVLAHRTGAINVDACRVESAEALTRAGSEAGILSMDGFPSIAALEEAAERGERCPNGRDAATTLARYHRNAGRTDEKAELSGRWPSNVVLAHHPDCGPEEAPDPCVPGCQVAALDDQSGTTTSSDRPRSNASHQSGSMSGPTRERVSCAVYGDTGGASRFFPTFRYQAKAPTSERPIVDGTGHPTVKPLGLMRWLVRLLVPGDDGAGGCGCVLDPFAGSGATLEAARLEGRRAVGVERDEHSIRLIAARLAAPATQATPPPRLATSPPAAPGGLPLTLFDEHLEEVTGRAG